MLSDARRFCWDLSATRSLAGPFFQHFDFIAGVDRVSLAWSAGALVLRKGGLRAMDICPSPLQEACAG